ncbi:Fe-S oxidoreductase, partial [Kitasatospora sp. NPDC047058]
MQLTAIVVSSALAVIGVALFGRAFVRILRFIRLGQSLPAGSRTDDRAARTATVLREFLGHTRMNRWKAVGVAHWFVAIAFFSLVLTLAEAFGQLFDAGFALPVVGHWPPYELAVEFLVAAMTSGILVLIGIRRLSHPRRPGRKSRFAGSNMGQAYFVETVILVIGVCDLTLGGLKGALLHVDHYEAAQFASYPVVLAFRGLSTGTLENLTYLFAGLKLATSFTWMITVSLNTDMGVAWHRFLAFPNIWFKREARGGVALGALQPMTSGGQPIDFEDPADDAVFGVSQVEHFSWKG